MDSDTSIVFDFSCNQASSNLRIRSITLVDDHTAMTDNLAIFRQIRTSSTMLPDRERLHIANLLLHGLLHEMVIEANARNRVVEDSVTRVITDSANWNSIV